MSIQVNPTHWLRLLLRVAGYNRPAGNRPVRDLDVLYRDDGTAVAIVRPPNLSMPGPRVKSLQDQFDAYLRRVLRQLQKLAASGVPVQHVFFIGGGPITIPRWFRDACADLGIRIHTVDPSLPPVDLSPFF